MLNKKAAWSYAAIAVLEIGLPILTLSDETNDPTVRVCEMAKFAKAMARWLHQFSAAMVKHQESECYQAALKYSSLDISEADRGNKPPSNDKTQRFQTATEHSPNDINHSFQSDSVPDDASSELQREGVWRESSPDPATEQDLSNLQYENAPASSSNSSEKPQKKHTKIPRRYS